jgi:hypothetical protein
MNWKSYPKKKDTPSRRTRKAARNSVFWFNYTLNRKRKSEIRRTRQVQNAE